MPWKPLDGDAFPTLGWGVLEWITENLAQPDNTDYRPLVLTPEQAKFVLNFYRLDPVTGKRVYRRAVWSRPKGHGKAEVLSAELPTPDGWITVGDVSAGDYLIGSDGKPVRVLQVHPVVRDIGYRVAFSDGSSSVFHGDHLFTVHEFYGGSKRRTVTLSVEDMLQKGLVYDRKLTTGKTKAVNGGVSRFALPDSPAWDMPSVNLPVDPYVLGYWLGDGDSDCARFTVGDGDIDEFLSNMADIGFDSPHISKQGDRAASRVNFPGTGLSKSLRGLGVFKNKHIPAVYLRASHEQRLALLQGLMDSDGSIDKTGRAEFGVCNEALVDGFIELLRTLGMRGNACESDAVLRGVTVGRRWRVSFTPRRQVFRLGRKAARVRDSARAPFPRVVSSIMPVGSADMRCITVDAEDGLYLTGRTMIVTHNSPLMGAIGCAEALADVVPDGWDANGQPVGKPWREVRTPLVQFAAVNEDQTRNAFDPLLEMLREGPVMDNYDVDPMNSFVALPKGRIEFITAAAGSKEGARPVWCALDQTEGWIPSNGGKKLAAVLRRNLGKVGGSSIETPNAFRPGENSVSEDTAAYYEGLKTGTARQAGLLYDHREAPADTDLADRESLRAGLQHVYGDSSEDAGGWINLDRLVEEIWDPATDPQDARQFYLNQVTHASDSWLSRPEIMAVAEPEMVVEPGETIVMGFDGSRGRAKGKADATALIGMTLKSRHLFNIRTWEKKDSDPQDWSPNPAEVDAVVRETFNTFKVVGFYADPSGWTSHIADWEADYGKRLKIRASRNEPISAWPRGKTTDVTRHVERFREAVVNEELSWDGSSVLMRHFLNARRRNTKQGYLLYKAYPDSPDKIDAAYAAVMAFKAFLDATSKGISAKPAKPRKVVFL